MLKSKKIIINITDSITEYFANNCSIDDLISNKWQLEIIGDQIINIYNKLKEQIKSNKSMIISTEKVSNISNINIGRTKIK